MLKYHKILHYDNQTIFTKIVFEDCTCCHALLCLLNYKFRFLKWEHPNTKEMLVTILISGIEQACQHWILRKPRMPTECDRLPAPCDKKKIIETRKYESE